MLRIRLLGELALEDDGEAIRPPESARARSLLAWLAVHRGMHARSRLAGLLRPDATEDSARKSLRDATWAIRQALGARADAALVADRDRIGLAAEVETDLGALRAALDDGHAQEALELAAAGEPLAGMPDEWALAARDELAARLDEALARLAGEAEARGDLAAAVRLSRERAARDPLAEEPARELVRRLAAAGDRGRALSAYEDFAARLRRELRAVPSAETRELAAAVRAGDAMPTGPGAASAASSAPASALTPPVAAPSAPAAVPIPEVRYARSGDANIAYAVVGDGPLDLVFVPGFVSHLEVLWEEPIAARFLRRLASFARVVLWDKREQGLSDRTGRAPTLEQSQDDLLAVMDAAGVERAAIFGISEGGPMSLLCAAGHPDRVASLVLWGTHARVLRDDDYPQGLPAAVVRRTIDELVAGWGGAPCLNLFAPTRADDPAFVAWWSRLLRSGTSAGAVRGVMAINDEIDVRDILPAVRAPTLVAHARDDRLVPLPLGEYLAEHIPGARLAVLPMRDHIPFDEHSDELLDAIEEHLTGARPARAPERVLTTVLFTDVVASTEGAARLGDRRWRAQSEEYRAIVRGEVARFRGREVSSTGDGALASFDGPARAVRCGQAIVGAAAARGIDVRAGVHTGECEVVGGDLAGLAVHIGARIGALAQPGEVLVSSTVRDLVVGSELAFAERGAKVLDGVPGRWRLLAARP